MWRPEAGIKSLSDPKFYIPAVAKTEERIGEPYSSYSHGPDIYPGRWRQRPHYCTSITVKTLTAHDLRRMWMETQLEDGVRVMLMWDPFGPIDWVADPFERLELINFAVSAEDTSCYTITVRGEDSNKKFNRQIRLDGMHHRRRLPVFCDCTSVDPHLFKSYTQDLQHQLERLLEGVPMTEEARLEKLDELIHGWAYAPAMQRLKESPEMRAEKAKKENKTMTKSDSPLGKVFDKIKTDFSGAAMHGAKVAMSVAATDEILARVVRRAVGQYYPEFFIKNPVGRVLEPIALAGTVLLGSYLMKAYTSARLPFQDEVESAARYSMEGKFRDLVELAKGPLFMVFNQIGAELAESGVVGAEAEEKKKKE